MKDNSESYINYVKISGIIDRVRSTYSGSYFVRIIQKDVLKNNETIQHFYKFYVEANKIKLLKYCFKNH